MVNKLFDNKYKLEYFRYGLIKSDDNWTVQLTDVNCLALKKLSSSLIVRVIE